MYFVVRTQNTPYKFYKRGWIAVVGYVLVLNCVNGNENITSVARWYNYIHTIYKQFINNNL